MLAAPPVSPEHFLTKCSILNQGELQSWHPLTKFAHNRLSCTDGFFRHERLTRVGILGRLLRGRPDLWIVLFLTDNTHLASLSGFDPIGSPSGPNTEAKPANVLLLGNC